MMPSPGTNENPAVFPRGKREPGGPAVCVRSRLVASSVGGISFASNLHVDPVLHS